MGVLAKYIDKPEITFPYSPAWSNLYDEIVDFRILVFINDQNEIDWTFLDMTFAKWEQIIDKELMKADITTMARRKMEKQLQLK